SDLLFAAATCDDVVLHPRSLRLDTTGYLDHAESDRVALDRDRKSRELVPHVRRGGPIRPPGHLRWRRRERIDPVPGGWRWNDLSADARDLDGATRHRFEPCLHRRGERRDRDADERYAHRRTDRSERAAGPLS